MGDAVGNVSESGAYTQPNTSVPEYFTIVKRIGTLVPFRPERISNAIESAFRATNQIAATEPLPRNIFQSVQKVTEDVVAEARSLVIQGKTLTVEGVQDIVEIKLMEDGFHDVARNYIVYRDEQKTLRDGAPQNIRIARRDGRLVRLNPIKIASAVEKAFRASRKIEGASPEDVIHAVNLLTGKVVQQIQQLHQSGISIEVEMIQDEIERQLMKEGFFEEAKDFIIYRAKRAELRGHHAVGEVKVVEGASAELAESKERTRTFQITNTDGTSGIITEQALYQRIQNACKGLGDVVSADVVLEESLRNFYEGISVSEVDKANLMAARARIEKEPAYSYVTARILLDMIYRETFSTEAGDSELQKKHREYFSEYIERGIELDRLNPALRDFDIQKLASAIKIERDQGFTFLSIQNLYDRYLIHHHDRRIETPQIFWMRVAMGLCLNEGDQKNDRAIEFYNVLSEFRFSSSTPTLFNSGTNHSQMSSCYLTTVKDDLVHIFKSVSDDARLSKWAGGLGNDWTDVRATGARIKGTNGKSQGIIPFLKVANDTLVAVNQGGKRKGAGCAYLETWHLDIEDFLELRKNTGDERRRTHDMNTANWIPDLFMKRVSENGTWTLFSPNDVADLHDLYGQNFEKRYEEYENMVENGEIQLFKKVEAVTLWRKMLGMLFETGHPWITFKDPSNIRSPQDHAGVVHSSNLCTEILLNTSEDEVAVCNLGSVNLARHMTVNGLDDQLLQKTIRTAIRMLDNVIDLNFYPIEEAKNANMRHRPIGLGFMGFQDALYIQNISYSSKEAVEFADESMEKVSYYAILASSELAKERGTYSTYSGSKWDKGLLPIDTLDLLEQERGAEWIELDKTTRMDWAPVREHIKQYGMRNSNTMAIAPTATISNIMGAVQSIEPSYKHLFAKSNLSGEFIIHNTYLVDTLKERGLWDEEMIDDLKYFDGSIQEIERIPDDIKNIHRTAFEIEPEWLIECASRRQKWIDMGQSLNLYMSEPSGKKLDSMYKFAWRKGLKTTYYLRSLAATQIEKSTTDVNRRGLQPRWMKNKSASADIQVARESAKAEAAVPAATCNLDGDCESCQ